MKNLIVIYADGACSGNPGPGGYGIIIRDNGEGKEMSGSESATTNNRMELRAVIEALKTVQEPRAIRIVTDSQYVVKGSTEYIHKWLGNNWRTANRKPVANRDLWEELLKLSEPHEILWSWVRGHSGHPENERCDELAVAAIEKLKNVEATI